MYELNKSLELLHPISTVWELIHDPLQLATCVPGMTEITALPQEKYRMQMHIKTGLLDTKAVGIAQIVSADPANFEFIIIGEGEQIMKGVKVRIHQKIFPLSAGCTLKINIKINGIPSSDEQLIMSVSAYYFDLFLRNVQNKLDGKAVDTTLHAGALISSVIKNKLKGWFKQ